MSMEVLLAVFIAAQIWVVVLLFAYLLWHRFARAWKEERRNRQIDELVDATLRWDEGEIDDGALLETLRMCSTQTAWEAFESVWGTLSPPARERLREMVRADDWYDEVRDAATSLFWWRRLDGCQALHYLAGPEDTDLLRELLWDRQDVVRMGALFAARERTLPDLIPDLMQRLIEAAPAQKSAIGDALLAYGDELVPVLRERLTEAEDPEVLQSCLPLAAEVPERVDDGSELAERILPLTTHEETEVRIKAVKALASYPDAPVQHALHSALADEEWVVRAQAAAALGAIESKISASQLREALGDPNWWVRLRAGIALRQLGETGLSVLQEIDATEDPYAHDMSQYVLRLDDRAVAQHAA